MMKNLSPALLIIIGLLVAPSTVWSGSNNYPSEQLRAEYKSAHDTLLQHFSAIQARSHLGAALEERLDGDASGIDLSGKPSWMTQADFQNHNSSCSRSTPVS